MGSPPCLFDIFLGMVVRAVMDLKGQNPIFYFSGTGTCLNAARRICAELPEFSPVPVAALAHEKNVTVDADAAGFVFPLYYTGLPLLVADFARKLAFARPCRVFAVVACGSPRGWALHQLDGLLSRLGVRLSAGFYLPGQSNYVPYNDLLSQHGIDVRVAAGEAKLGEIVRRLKDGEWSVEEERGFLTHAVYPYFVHAVPRWDRHFRADKNCTACGTCAQVCPVNNIELKQGKPEWKHRCQFCLACIHFCPQKAIQWKDVTQSRGRYHYKGISAADIAAQKRL